MTGVLGFADDVVGKLDDLGKPDERSATVGGGSDDHVTLSWHHSFGADRAGAMPYAEVFVCQGQVGASVRGNWHTDAARAAQALDEWCGEITRLEEKLTRNSL